MTGVQFKLDGANLGSEDTSAPYAVTWNTATAANGPHTLSAVARDAAGNTQDGGHRQRHRASTTRRRRRSSLTAPAAAHRSRGRWT